MPKFEKDFWWSSLFGGKVALPQFIKKSDGSAALLQGEKGVFTQLVDTNGNPISSANPVPTELKNSTPIEIKQTGRGVQEVLFHNALAITDTVNKDVNPPAGTDISAISGRKTLMIFSTLNQPVVISLLVRNKAGSAIVAGNKTIAAATYGVITAADIPALADVWPSVTVRASCATAPTNGSISVYLEGVQA